MKQNPKLVHVTLDEKSIHGLDVASALLGISRSELLRRFGYLMLAVALWDPPGKDEDLEVHRAAFAETLASWSMLTLSLDLGPDAKITPPERAATEGA